MAEPLDKSEAVPGLEFENSIVLRPAERWKDAILADLIEHIESRHHVFTRNQLVKLEALLDTASRDSGASLPHLEKARSQFQTLRRDLSEHLEKEELHLFAGIRAMENGGPIPTGLQDVRGLLDAAREEHLATKALLALLDDRGRSNPVPATPNASLEAFQLGLKELEEDLHLHVYLENSLLFPRVLAEAEARRR